MYEEKDNEGRIWTAMDEMATEHEVGDFLYGLIRMAKPLHAIETGTYRWSATIQMIRALRMNKRGFLNTCDIIHYPQPDIAEDSPYHDFHEMKGVDMIPMVADNQGLIDFAFLDSGDDRLAEAIVLSDWLTPDALVVIHDTQRQREIETMEYLSKQCTGCQVLEFMTPRGLGVMRLLK